ncbi:MAG: hypothetical protein Q7K03_01445 [Dehalococcoidia bacterium]|nr:hypothetical protein [Dehalococcoidia bacterium]
MAKLTGFNERYIVDKAGNRTAVILDVRDYRQILEEAEELESIRAFDEAKASGDIAIPFEQAVEQIERSTKVTRRSDDEVWDIVRKSVGETFPTLTGREQDRVVRIDDEDEKVVIENVRTSKERQITRHDVIHFYREVFNRKGEPLMLVDIKIHTPPGELRDTKVGVGASLLGLLLHLFPNELRSSPDGRRVGLRVKE